MRAYSASRSSACARHRGERVVDQVRRVLEDRELGAVVEEVAHCVRSRRPGPGRTASASPSACWFHGTRCVVPAPRISAQVREVPVVGRAQRLGVREPRLPAEQLAGLLDRDERVPVRRPVVPLGERREPRELERPQRRARRARPAPAAAASPSRRGRSAPAGRRARCRTTPAPTLSACPADRSVERTDDGVDEILDGEQLVEVAAVAEDRDAPPLADPVEQDLEDAEPLGPDERLRPDTITTSRPRRPNSARQPLGLDLRLAVPADADERVVLVDRDAARARRRRRSTRSGRRGARPPRAPRRARSPCPRR